MIKTLLFGITMKTNLNRRLPMANGLCPGFVSARENSRTPRNRPEGFILQSLSESHQTKAQRLRRQAAESGHVWDSAAARVMAKPMALARFVMFRWLTAGALIHLLSAGMQAADTATPLEVKSLTVNGGLSEDQARLVIQANLKTPADASSKALVAISLEHTIHATRDVLQHSCQITCDLLQGDPREINLPLAGEGDVIEVKADWLQDWSVRRENSGQRLLVLRPKKTDSSSPHLVAVLKAETKLSAPGTSVSPLAIAALQPSLLHGYLKLDTAADLSVRIENSSGLMPIEEAYLPVSMRGANATNAPEPMAFRFQGSAYTLNLKLGEADPEGRQVVLSGFSLTGKLNADQAAFSVTAVARVRHPKGGALNLLSGRVALTSIAPIAGGRMAFEGGSYVLHFDRDGEYPLRLEFDAAVAQVEGWSTLDFRIAPSPTQPVTLRGLAAETQFRFSGAARPEWIDGAFHSFLPAGGGIKLAWKEARPESEGKLFYALDLRSQLAVSPGLMRQWALFEGRVMQGELTQLELNLSGQGEVTRVLGDQVLSWSVDEPRGDSERLLVVRFNQPQKEGFSLQVQSQTPLGAFPQTFAALQMYPRNATRFTGYYRVFSDGAVRLEVSQAAGLSQISPEQVPDASGASVPALSTGPVRFAFRFSGAGHQLRLQADSIWPEISVSQLAVYHLGETESAIDVELELEVREAPLRELLLRVPQGYGLARLNASGMSDYFLQPETNATTAQLRLVYAQPLSGRQVVQLRLERTQPLSEPAWALPRIELLRAKSVRGYVGITADPGYRLTPTATDGLTEVATAFFPKKLSGIQTAFRLNDPVWRASFKIERLPQTVQADVVHLFSVGEGIAYGSSIINYLISGAPRSTFLLQLSNEYANVEFTGKDIRSWRQTTNGFEIQLHAPVAGVYNLLATYERSFKPQGETLTFTGARPLDAQTEQGYTLVVSTYQFQVKPVNVSAGLLALEPGEVPAEYRLFFDAPLLAAYRYTSRPYALQLALSPLIQGQTLGQVVDRASLSTRISKEGQVLTDARYLVKNRGQPHFRLTLPPETQLWSVTVNGAACVPIADGATNLIPLPQNADPSAVHTLDFKLASRSKDARRISVAAPIAQAPVLLAEWSFQPESGHRLLYQGGTLKPARQPVDISGFAGLRRLFSQRLSHPLILQLASAFGLVLVSVLLWRWTYRSGVSRLSLRHIAGTGLGLIAAALACYRVAQFLALSPLPLPGATEAGLVFLAPVQQPASALQIQVLNVPDAPGLWGQYARAWPVLIAVALWLYAWVTSRDWFRPLGRMLGWIVLAWTALRWPNGVSLFFSVMMAFMVVHVIVPLLKRLWHMPVKPKPTIDSGSAAAAAVVMVLLSLLGAHCASAQSQTEPSLMLAPVVAETINQEIKVQDQYVSAVARIQWNATNGQVLPLLYPPGVLTEIRYATNALRLFRSTDGAQNGLSFQARQSGTFELELHYQTQTETRDGVTGFVLPTHYGLVNQLSLTLTNLDVDVYSDHAVSVQRLQTVTNTVTAVQLVLAPGAKSWIGWKPRSRDTRREHAVYYAELYQLYAPSSGVIEGVHQAQIRPAQGELGELEFIVPSGLTVTDVVDPALGGAGASSKQVPAKSIISWWRFNPDRHSLRISLNPPQSKPFMLRILSQIAAGPLPFEQAVGLISLTNAAGQIGLLGIATGNEVQLDGVQAEGWSPISLEDFPAALAPALPSRSGGVTLRRAYRYASPTQLAIIKAAAVEPDIRVEYQQTLSLGEDRMVLAVNAKTDITRAGIFRLSFMLPPGLDLESLSGTALSHWTEVKTDAGRIITMHLKGKTDGQQAFDLNLTGPGQRAVKNWSVPQFSLREASKQRGQLTIVPEQGLRLQLITREGVTQLDPQKAGIRQKGVLVFRLLQESWKLVLDTELIDPWIQVTSLQHVQVNEAQAKVTANLQYQIENAGLKSFRVRLPDRAESVRFQGEQVADFMARPEAAEKGLREWEVKLHRRMLGTYLLQVSYLSTLPENARQFSIQGVQASGVNLQRGFLTIQADGRLQTQLGALPATLQPAEWQSIPRALLQGLPAQTANNTFRLVDPSFELALGLERHDAAKLLPARVNQVSLTSVISDDGVMLTQVRLAMVPGDKRLLQLTLPAEAQFWYAFVNQNGVWPWREQERILIPLEQQARTGQNLTVEFFYTSRVGAGGKRRLDLSLAGPKFDLPLENIEWRVYLNEKWQLRQWQGALQLTSNQLLQRPTAIDMTAYLKNEESLQRQKTEQAETMLQTANSLLQQGDPQQARRAFQAAYGLSQHDNAFNEDARVQLHNLKMQQALVGLNLRQASIAGDQAAVAAKAHELRGDQTLAYTQDEAKQMFARNSAEENAAQLKLAERIIQQQDAAQTIPAAIRASIPEQGRLLTFHRPVQVDTWADLRVDVLAVPAKTVSYGLRFLILLIIAAGMGLFSWLARPSESRTEM
jgi:hypothetical protein